ncbi:hypothetical protein [Alteriqipengyuania sp.]
MNIELKKPKTYLVMLGALLFLFLAGYGAGNIAAKLVQAVG